jgi:hypothetical protein
LVRAPTIQYNLAVALFELDELREARDLLDAARAHPDTTPDAAAAIDDLTGRVNARGGAIRVELEGATVGVEVLLGDEPVAPETLGTPMWVLPGSYVVRGVREGVEVARHELVVAAGDSVVATLVVAPTPAATAAAAPGEPADPEPVDGSGTVFGTWWFWAGVGVVAVAAVVLVVVLSADDSDPEPVQGDFEPGLVRWP